jgi:hypothetical protein
MQWALAVGSVPECKTAATVWEKCVIERRPGGDVVDVEWRPTRAVTQREGSKHAVVAVPAHRCRVGTGHREREGMSMSMSSHAQRGTLARTGKKPLLIALDPFMIHHPGMT